MSSTSAESLLKAVTAMALSLGMISNSVAESNEEFLPHCQQWLESADSFAQECLANARGFSRTFYPSGGSRGEVETYSAYFSKSDAVGHFSLGCTLNWKHQISFVGIYYSVKGTNFSDANTAPIRSVDAQGNVGLLINGKPVTLLAVRQFGTDTVPLRYPEAIAPKNCEVATQGDGYFRNVNGALMRLDGDLDVKAGSFAYCTYGACGPREEFVQFFVTPRSEGFYEHNGVFVGSGGNIFVSKKRFDMFCGDNYRRRNFTESITQELCEFSK